MSCTSISSRDRSEDSHSTTGRIRSVDHEAFVALVISSDTSSSAFSLNAASHHSQSTSLACNRAHATAPGSAPSSRWLLSGQSSVMVCPGGGDETWLAERKRSLTLPIQLPGQRPASPPRGSIATDGPKAVEL